MWWRIGDVNAVLDVPFDGIAVALFILIANPITIAILVLAVRLARASQVEYLALSVPQTRDLRLGIICLVVLIALSDALLYFSGQPLVTPFQLQSYTTAAAEGWLAPFLIAAVIVAPASEEIIFRGFLFRGWARSDRAAWPAIVVISVLWAGAACSVRLDRHPADFRYWTFSRLDALAQRLSAADHFAARLIQPRRHGRNDFADPVFQLDFFVGRTIFSENRIPLFGIML